MAAVNSRLLNALPPLAGPVEAPVAPVKPRVQPQTSPPIPEPLWHVILINDDDHTFDYVIEMLASIFGHPTDKAYLMAKEVDEKGRVIVATVHKELAELRQEQIMDYGPDPRIPKSPGSMRAEIEPAT